MARPLSENDDGPPDNGPPFDIKDDDDTKRIVYSLSVAEKKKKEKPTFGEVCQWSTDGKIFTPSKTTLPDLIPGAYEIGMSPQIGLYFEKYPVKDEELLKFPDTTSDRVIDEVRKFWKVETKERFYKYKLPYKRGILLWGPPGGGKSSVIQFIMRDIINMGGVVINFANPDVFITGIRTLRQIQAQVPVVVIMEDIDAILDHYNESSVLNILDGADKIDNTIFIATTNYPEELSERIVDRPSRFDKRFKVPMPDDKVRAFYFEHLFKQIEPERRIDFSGWVEDTEGLSIAHLKELFVAVMILDNPYAEAIQTITNMKEEISSEQDRKTDCIGFAANKDSKGVIKKIGFGA